MHWTDVRGQAHEQIRRASLTWLLLVHVLLAYFDDRPDEDEAILADCSELITTRIELAEPYLLLVSTQGYHTCCW